MMLSFLHPVDFAGAQSDHIRATCPIHQLRLFTFHDSPTQTTLPLGMGRHGLGSCFRFGNGVQR